MLLDIPLLVIYIYIYIYSVDRSELAGMQRKVGGISSQLMAKAGTADPQMASA